MFFQRITLARNISGDRLSACSSVALDAPTPRCLATNFFTGVFGHFNFSWLLHYSRDAAPKYLRRRRPFRKSWEENRNGQAVSKLATLQIPTTGEPSTAGVCYAARKVQP
jgi:hypothetical protein